MKKLLIVLFMLFFASTSYALPNDKPIWKCCWTANTESDLANYDLYWRTIGTTVWTAANSIQVSLSATPCQTLTGVVPYNSEICVTASDTSGNESGCSAILPFAKDGTSPSNPSGAVIKQ